mgnify:CR=1 FL=1
MRNKITNKAWGIALAGLTAAAALAATLADTGSAFADARRITRGTKVDDQLQKMASGAQTQHQSVIRVDDRGGPVRKPLHIGLGKSALLEFSRELRDVMVSTPEAVDAVMLSSNRVFLLAKKLGESNAFFFDSNGEQFAAFELYVQRDTTGLQSLLTRLIPGSNIVVEMMNETIILTGRVRTPIDSNMASQIAKNFVSVELKSSTSQSSATGVEVKQTSIEAKEKVINMLAVEGEEQVMLRVTVAEVQRTMLKQFGINWSSDISIGSFATQLMTANSLPLTAAAGLGKLPIPGFDPNIGDKDKNGCAGATCFYNEGPTSKTFGNSGTTSGWRGGNQDIRQAMRFLERNGLVKTLAEPNLTAVSGEPAKFLAGGEYPIPTVDSTGQVTVTYKEFGVGVAFTPIVMSEGRISLKIEAEVSELSSEGAVQLSNLQIPALKKRSSKSTIELPSGGSIALAGLISEDTRQNIDGMPGLKDLPVLGTLFKSRDFIKSETELVIIVTPYIVKPTAAKELARPLDGLVEASDMKANFLGHLNRIYGRGNSMPTGDLKGDYGFIVE